jgi:hypothetical protein
VWIAFLVVCVGAPSIQTGCFLNTNVVLEFFYLQLIANEMIYEKIVLNIGRALSGLENMSGIRNELGRN